MEYSMFIEVMHSVILIEIKKNNVLVYTPILQKIQFNISLKVE